MPLTVTTTSDEAYDSGDVTAETSDGNGLSIREAIALIAAGTTNPIQFDASLSGMTSFMTGGVFDINFDLTLDAESNDFGISNNIGGSIFDINMNGVTFINRGLNLQIDASGTTVDRVPVIIIDADNVNFTNEGDIRSTGYFGGIGDTSVGVKINGSNYTLVNGADANIVSQGRFAIESTNGTITNAGYIEAADDTIRLYEGTINNSGTIRTTGTTDLNGAYDAPGIAANAISLLGHPAGYVAPAQGVVTINNTATGVIEGLQAAIRSSGGGVIDNDGAITGNSSALLIQPLAGSEVAFTLDNSGTITRNGGSLGLTTVTPASIIIANGLTSATITNSGSIISPDAVIVSYMGTTLTNTSTGTLDGDSDKIGNDAVAFRGAHETDFPIFVTTAFPSVNPGLVSAQEGVVISAFGITYLGRNLQLPNSQVQTIQAQINGAPGVIALLDLDASLSTGFAIFQRSESGGLLFPASVDIPTTELGTVRLARQPDGVYAVTDLNDNVISNVPDGDYNDVITNHGQIIGDVLTGMGNDSVTNIGNLIGDVDLGSGNDVFDGSASAQGNIVRGGSGNDLIIGGAGDDTLDGGDGVDRLNYEAATSRVIVNLTRTTAQDTQGAGTDTITNFEQIIGSDFGDILIGNSANNYLIGGEGNDYIDGGDAGDFLDGGAGTSDWVSYQTSTAGVRIDLSDTGVQATNDIIANFENLEGSDFRDILFGDGGDNYIDGQDGNDYIRGGLGNDRLDGGAGTSDWVSYLDANSGVIVDLSETGFQNTLGDGVDRLTNFENLEGSDFNDILGGDDGNNYIDGQAGNDLLLGDLGTDTLVGGAGVDRVSYSDMNSRVIIDLSNSNFQDTGGAGLDLLIGIEQIEGTDFRDILFGNSGNNVLIGGAGNDYIDGGASGDFLDGGAGTSDWVSFQSERSGVTIDLSDNGVQSTQDIIRNFENLEGSDFGDDLSGDAGANFVDGQDGHDFINGGSGNDILNGGSGGDLFIFDAGFGNDTVLDYQDGAEQLQFRIAGLTSFSQLTVTQDGADTLITYDGNSVRLTGITATDITSADVAFAAPPAPAEPNDNVDIVSEKLTNFDVVSETPDSFDFKTDVDVTPIAEVMDDATSFDVSDTQIAEFQAQLETLSYETSEGDMFTYVNEYGVLSVTTPDDDAYWDMVG